MLTNELFLLSIRLSACVYLYVCVRARDLTHLSSQLTNIHEKRDERYATGSYLNLLFLNCTHEAEWTPSQTHCLSENLVAPGFEPRPLDL
jgi:hypothetical protein